MREILFRGKRKDNGEWIEGFFWQDIWGDGKSCFIHYDTKDYEVIPETVRQYTGIDDFYSHRIFEHDIISLKYVDWDEEKVVSCYGLVTWNTHEGTWFCILYTEDGIKVEELYNSRMCNKVVGNIHDNPELLEGN